MKFLQKLFFATLVFVFTALPASGQNIAPDYFPKITIGVSTGYYMSFVESFEHDINQEPLFGAHFGYEIINLGSSAVYGIFHFNHFVARENGRDLIKWQQDHLNFGLRYSIALPFLERPNAQLWISSGLNILDLSRKDFKTRTVFIWDGNKRRKVNIDESIIDKWNSQNFFFEIGQMIPFEMSNTPNLALFWALKYDRGKDNSVNLGGISFILGFNFAAFYNR
ncbi:MAG: hypothetical protein ACE5I1_22585 [bacterium]